MSSEPSEPAVPEELTPPVAMPTEDALELLSKGELTIEGRVTTASNATLYCRIELDGIAAACVYKPVTGERPLWDYPDGTLAERERATFLTSEATGWHLVPATVLRDGPLGEGMVQLWIEADDDFDIIGAINSGESEALQRIALFDAVINNSDRKVSHLLPLVGPVGEGDRGDQLGQGDRGGQGGRVHILGVDHGVSFGIGERLRTVLWQWAGVRIPDDQHEMLQRLDAQLAGELGEALGELLTRAEIRATRQRVRSLITSRLFPLPGNEWPAVPYPPY